MAKKIVEKNIEKGNKVEKRDVILKARVTEKGALGAEERGVYVFNVEKTATKKTVMQSIKAKHNVTAKKVNIVNIPKRSVFIRGKKGSKGGGKKAYVFLKKGDKIEFA